MTAVTVGTVLLALLLLTPVVLERRIRRRIADQERAAGIPAAGAAAPAAAVPIEAVGAGEGPAVDPPAVPLFELLDGMTMPCDLAPLTNVEPLPAGTVDRLVFVTDWPADRVRADLKGALAAVEFDLSWGAGNEGVATRDGTGFRVRLHATPDAVVVGSRPAFPTAGSGTTVLELAAP